MAAGDRLARPEAYDDRVLRDLVAPVQDEALAVKALLTIIPADDKK